MINIQIPKMDCHDTNFTQFYISIITLTDAKIPNTKLSLILVNGIRFNLLL